VKHRYRARPLFIGRGGRFKKPPRNDRCAFSGGRMSTPMFRGWRFYRNSEDFSWKRIVGVNPLPQGASVGNWAKTFHPRNVRVAEFMNIFVSTSRGRCSISWQENVHGGVLLFFTWFTDLLMLWEIIAELASDRKSAFSFRTTGVRRIRETWGTFFRLKILKFSSENLDEWWFSWMKVRRSKED
jgi:hypothetical protein